MGKGKLTRAESALHAQAVKLTKAQASQALLEVLRQVEQSRLYLCFGLRTLTDYCRHQLRMPEAQARAMARAAEGNGSEPKAEPDDLKSEAVASFWDLLTVSSDDD